MDAAETTQVEASTVTDAASLAGSSTSTEFVSNWQFDSSSTNHNVIFQHGLGTIPSSLLVLFSSDLATVYPIQWGTWGHTSNGNPVSIWMDAKTITLSISSSSILHGWWIANAGWFSANSGFWRVVASV